MKILIDEKTIEAIEKKGGIFTFKGFTCNS